MEIANQITAWELKVVFGLTFAVLVKNGEALLWAAVFFHIPINGEVDIVKAVAQFYVLGSTFHDFVLNIS